MLANEDTLRRMERELIASQRILLVSHVHPDGDAVGSLLGLGLVLQSIGKDVQMILADGVPGKFRFLQGSQQIRSHPMGIFDFTVVLDCSDLERVGGVLDGRLPPDLNIDHHQTNLSFARFNLVDVNAVATAEMIVDLCAFFGLRLTGPAVTALLVGLITDTIGFRTSNMTPKALRLAADLMEMGADLPDLYQRALVDRSFEAARLWGAGLAKLERDGRMVWTSLTQSDRRVANYPGLDDAELVNELSAIEEADIVMVFIEKPEGRVKVSWRARPGLDVARIAHSFGGGGHAAASGAEIPGSLVEVQDVVLSRTRTLLNGEHKTE